MARARIFALIGLIALGMSCAGGERAPRGKGTGKKPPPARTTYPASAPAPRIRPTTAPSATGPAIAPSPTTTQAIAAAKERLKIHETHRRMAVVVVALDIFEIDIGRYPTADEGLEALVKKPVADNEAVADMWHGPYLKKMPLDAWGRPFRYEPAKDRKARSPYRLWSAGPDGVSGTADDAREDRPPPRTTRPAAPSPTTTQVAVSPWQKARIDATRLVLQTVGAGLDRYKMDIGRYPTEDEGGLEALLKRPEVEDDAVLRNWRGPYLKEMPKDAWGRHIDHEWVEDPKVKPRYRIWSAGPDRMSGTDDDIRNWVDE